MMTNVNEDVSTPVPEIRGNEEPSKEAANTNMNSLTLLKRYVTVRSTKRTLFYFISFLICLLVLFSYAENINVPRPSAFVTRSRQKLLYADVGPALPPIYRGLQHLAYLNEEGLFLNYNFTSRDRLKPMPEMRNKYLSYLQPVTTLYRNNGSRRISSATRLWIEDAIRTGYGLESYKTEEGESAWIENGIVYRPWRKPLPVPGLQVSSHQAEYEAFIPFNEDLFFEGRKPDPMHKSKPKIILWHTPTGYTDVNNDLDPMRQCPDFPCRMATNVSRYYDQSSAILFSASRIKGYPPVRKSPNQVFVLHNHEPQTKTFWMDNHRQESWRSAFNWTFTYRMDSDIVMPFGILRKRPKASTAATKDYKGIVANKTSTFVWMVSKCQSDGLREWYVTELQKYIQIEILGQCGSMQCTRSMDSMCTDEIGQKYKFVLAFESAICTDYITDKLFRYLTRDIIVVARGSDEYFRHLPPETFINTNDFSSPKQLAELLIHLDKNQDAYISMLKAKDRYTSIYEDYVIREPGGSIQYMHYFFSAVPMCQMCQRLWNLERYAKRIGSIHQWLGHRKCRLPQDVDWAAIGTNVTANPYKAEEAALAELHENARRRLEERLKAKSYSQFKQLRKGLL